MPRLGAHELPDPKPQLLQARVRRGRDARLPCQVRMLLGQLFHVLRLAGFDLGPQAAVLVFRERRIDVLLR